MCGGAVMKQDNSDEFIGLIEAVVENVRDDSNDHADIVGTKKPNFFFFFLLLL
jgi:hypothetical protein